MKPDRMKAKIARGEPALGCSLMVPSPQIAEMLGCAGFDGCSMPASTAASVPTTWRDGDGPPSVGAAVFCGAALRLWPKRSRRYAERS